MSAIFYVSYVALWILLLVQGVLLLLVYRHFGLAALGTVEGVQRDGLPVGELAPTFSGVSMQGDTINWEPASGRTHFLAFVSAECTPCARILPAIHQVAKVANRLAMTLVVTGPQENMQHLVEKFHPPLSITYLADDGNGTPDRYRVRVTPFAFVVGEDGRILAKGLCDSPMRLQQLLAAGGQEFPRILEVMASQ